jgi:hypothetical protein
LLFEVIKTALELDDGTTLDVIAQRMAAPVAEEDYAEHVLNIEEAVDVLEEQDIKVLNNERKDLPKHQAARQDFKKEYIKKRATVIATPPPAPAPAPVPKRRGRGRAVPEACHVVAVDLIPDNIEQSTAKRFLPPGASIWCGHKRHEWCGWMPPMTRISYMWRMLIRPG